MLRINKNKSKVKKILKPLNNAILKITLKLNQPCKILLAIPSTKACVVSSTWPSEVISNRRNWKKPAGPEWEWVPDITTFFSLNL